MYEFFLAHRTYIEQFDRVSIITIIGNIGGLLFTSISLADALNTPFANYTKEVMMLRKLYSVNKNEDPIF